MVVGVPRKIVGEPSEKQLWGLKEGLKKYTALARQDREQGL
jgi:hypothetical protein